LIGGLGGGRLLRLLGSEDGGVELCSFISDMGSRCLVDKGDTTDTPPPSG
jgi:hypothetical protein